MYLLLLLLTAGIGVFLLNVLTTKPSLERSQEFYRQSILFFPFGIIVSVLWYILWFVSESNNNELLVFSSGSFIEALLFLIGGFIHWTKYREYTRITLEIEEGLSDTASAE
jgi:uncharacterized membrane protein